MRVDLQEDLDDFLLPLFFTMVILGVGMIVAPGVTAAYDAEPKPSSVWAQVGVILCDQEIADLAARGSESDELGIDGG